MGAVRGWGRIDHVARSILIVVLGSIGCGASESLDDRCMRVREQIITLEIGYDNEARARVMRRALGDAFLDRCRHTMTDSQRECVLAATDSKAAFTCIAVSHATRGGVK